MNLTSFRYVIVPVYFFAAVVWLSTAACAVPLTIYNTGVDPSASALLGTGTLDTHYSIISPAGNTAVTVNDPGYPIGPGLWYANNAGSRWIGPSGNGNGVSGPWIYRTTFNVPGAAILGSVNVSGTWATDDVGTDIRINGSSTGQTDLGMTTPAPFSVSSGFVLGLNTLDFYLTNAPGGINPTGLRVDHIAGSYSTVPEPGTAALVAAAFVISVTAFRRSRSASPLS